MIESACKTTRPRGLIRGMGMLFLGAMLAASVATANELPTLGDPSFESLSYREEDRIGQAYYQSIMASVPVVNDVQLNYYLKSLAQKLVTQSDYAGKQFTFFIMDSPAINAFALPGGYIGINSGLMIDAETESQLASVLAHEISHVTQRHIARMFDESGNSTVLSIATILAALLVGSASTDAGQAVLMSGMAGMQQSSINYTRQHEYEADRIGFRLLVDAGINPEGMVEFFEHLMAQGGGLQIEYLSTHPLDINRVTEARNRIKDEHRQLPKNSEDYLFAKVRLSVLTNRNNALLKLIDLNRDNPGQIARYLTALALTRTDRADEAIPILRDLSEAKQHPWIRLALAEAYEKDGRMKQALRTMELLHDLYPGYLPVTLAFARMLNHEREPRKSIELLLHQLQTDTLPDIYEELARAYYLNGQVGAALEATGNQYVLQGFLELAMQQYDNALNQPDISDTTKKRLETRKTELTERVKRRQE